MRTTAAIVTLGCKTNQFESAVMEEKLSAAGYEIIPFAEGAELVVVNTCTVTAATDSQSRNLIRRSYRLNKNVRIVVTGCYAQVRPSAFRHFPGVSLVLGNEEKNDLLGFLEHEAGVQRVHVSDIRAHSAGLSAPAATSPSRSRAFLQVQNGCDAFCSYCIIPYARGTSRSFPVASILRKVQSLAEQGFQEVVLTGIHLGDFGRRFSSPASFFDLVETLHRNSTIKRLRIGSIEPNELDARLIDMMADSEKICPHFHIPLQSGDDRVLERMRRPYNSRLFRDLVTKIHSRVPDVGVGVDVIVGFPGETEQQFQNTRDLIKSLPLSYLHVFPYSARPGTDAAGYCDQLPAPLIKERAACLRELAEYKKKIFMSKQLGKILKVVVEDVEAAGMHQGLSGNYLKVLFPCSQELQREIVQVTALSMTSLGLAGKMLLPGPGDA